MNQRTRLLSVGLPLLLSMSIGLSFEPEIAKAQSNTAKVNIGCQQGITKVLHSGEVGNRLLALQVGSTYTDLVRIAGANCILKQRFAGQGDPNYSEFAYGIEGWGRCYVKATVERGFMRRQSHVSRVEKICL